MALWPHPERHTARRRGQPHPRQRLPRPVGPVRREITHSSPHPRHRPERQPCVHTFAEPDGIPQESRAPQSGDGVAQTDAATAITRPLRFRLPKATLRALRRRLRAGLHRDKGRSQAGQGVSGSVPARYTQVGTVQREDPYHPRHQPGGEVPGLRPREPTGQ